MEKVAGTRSLLHACRFSVQILGSAPACLTDESRLRTSSMDQLAKLFIDGEQIGNLNTAKQHYYLQDRRLISFPCETSKHKRSEQVQEAKIELQHHNQQLASLELVTIEISHIAHYGSKVPVMVLEPICGRKVPTREQGARYGPRTDMWEQGAHYRSKVPIYDH
nr:hypothetical protein Iba_chr05aCG7660 [Ipomoea batatas]